MCDLIPGTLRKSSFRAIYVQGYLNEGFHNNICASSNYENRKSLANKCHRFCIKANGIINKVPVDSDRKTQKTNQQNEGKLTITLNILIITYY